MTTELERRRSLLLQGGGPELSESLNGSTDAADFLIFNVQTDNSGSSEDDQFVLPLQSGFPYNFELTYDGKTQIVTGNQDVLLEFPSGAGNYDIKISGIFSGVRFNNLTNDKLKILDVVQWGAPVWRTFERAFFGCANLVGTYTDTPSFSGVSSFLNGLRGCSLWTGTVDDWDMSAAVNLQMFLRDCAAFNKPVNSWDVRNVENLQAMFQNATIFNQPVNLWVTDSLINMRQVWKGAPAFNQDVSALDTSQVTDMLECFRNAFAFVQTIESWNIEALLTPGMTNIFNAVVRTTDLLNRDYISFESQNHPIGITYHGGSTQHSGAGTTARNILTSAPSLWNISDFGPVP